MSVLLVGDYRRRPATNTFGRPSGVLAYVGVAASSASSSAGREESFMMIFWRPDRSVIRITEFDELQPYSHLIGKVLRQMIA